VTPFRVRLLDVGSLYVGFMVLYVPLVAWGPDGWDIALGMAGYALLNVTHWRLRVYRSDAAVLRKASDALASQREGWKDGDRYEDREGDVWTVVVVDGVPGLQMGETGTICHPAAVAGPCGPLTRLSEGGAR
jgi:hypothetical protein